MKAKARILMLVLALLLPALSFIATAASAATAEISDCGFESDNDSVITTILPPPPSEKAVYHENKSHLRIPTRFDEPLFPPPNLR